MTVITDDPKATAALDKLCAECPEDYKLIETGPDFNTYEINPDTIKYLKKPGGIEYEECDA